jgi:hypothetical protein
MPMRILRRPAAYGRNNSDHTEFVVEKAMMMFRIVAAVGQQRAEPMPFARCTQQRLELDIIGLGAAIDHCCKTEMRARLDAGRELGITPVFPAATLAEVAGDVSRFPPAGIGGNVIAPAAEESSILCPR